MRSLEVSLLREGQPRKVGTLSRDDVLFRYDEGYLLLPEALPLSASLPLRAQPFTEREFRPYFEGLIAEGSAKQELVAHLQLPDDDYLLLLEACGKDCIGDVLVTASDDPLGQGECSYKPMTSKDVLAAVATPFGRAAANVENRLSLAGTQGKTGLAHDPTRPIAEGWFAPRGLAASTHILKTSSLRDVPEVEFLCMQAAAACGVRTAPCALLGFATPTLAVQRFDREARVVDGTLSVARLHQEDCAQAFGVLPAAKYAELPGGTVKSIVRMLAEGSARPARDVAEFARRLCFSYLIGDCDSHLKNHSVLYAATTGQGRPAFSLAPAYDLVSTTVFPRFSRSMAMDFGGVRDIDAVDSAAFVNLAAELSITASALRTIARQVASGIVDALQDAGSGACGPVLESTPYIAEDLIQDLRPRLAVLREFCG